MKRVIGILLTLTILLAPAPAVAQAVVLPVDGYYERQTVKGFGVLVDDAYHAARRELFPNNGYQNQFTGYHAAVDVEFYQPEFAGKDVPVRAVAAGEVIYFGSVAGYGGVMVIRHGEPEAVTTLYGHITRPTVRVGDRVAAGQTIAYLGESFTAETSGARKHLHFGVHKGSQLDIAGHEQSAAQLQAEWYDPNVWLARYVPRTDPGLTAVAATPSPSPSPEPFLTPAPAEPKPSWLDRLIDFFAGLFR